MTVPPNIKAVIEGTVRGQFPATLITSVHVTADADSDGDPIFRIYVVFDSSNPASPPDAGKMVGLVRHLRIELMELAPDRFPLVSFVSNKDVAKLNLEAA